MKKLILTLFTIMSAFSLSAQTLDIGPPDTSICDGGSIDIIATTNVGGGGMTVPVILSDNDPFTPPSLGDDQYSDVIPMTFNFDYYGNVYNQLVVSSNSYVTFDLTQANGGSAWSINAAAPNGVTTNDRIMFPWQDTNPATGGIISYMVCGDAPNRVFIVDFSEVGMFNCPLITFTNQLKLFETSNRVEIHITNKPLCAAWNGGAAIQGLENINGTVGHVVPGRNFPVQWNVVNDGYEFVPDGLGGYVMNPIPFDPAPLQNTQINWYVDDMNGVPIATDVDQINVSPIVDTWYYCEAVLPCGVGFSLVDSILVHVGTTIATLTPGEVSCNGFSDGFIEVNSTGTTHPPLEYELYDELLVYVGTFPGNGPIDTIHGLNAGIYTVVVVNQIGCITTEDTEILEPDVLFANGDHSDISCWGENDGFAYVYPFGGTTPYTYQWTDPLNQTTQRIEFLGPGNVQLTITDANGCTLDTNMSIIEPLQIITNVETWADTCYRHNGQIFIEMFGGTSPFTYTWFTGINTNNSTIDDINNTNLVTGLPYGTYELSVSDLNGCSIDISTEVNLISPPVAGFHQQFPSVATEIINADILFDNTSTNAESYEWLFGDGYGSSITNPTHTYGDAGTYLVQLIAYSDPNLGCTDTAYGYTTIDPLYTFYVPNSFTPDGDGLNDWFRPEGQFFETESYNLKVYDRWGKIMFNTDNPNMGWNGRYLNTGSPVKLGVYVYIFELKKFNTFEPKTITGIVHVYRNR
jgi:gliding motility-associated-like protein